MLYLFIVDGQGGQTVQFQPGGMPGNVLVVALCGDHRAVVAAELQLRQVNLCTQLLGTVIYQLAQTATPPARHTCFAPVSAAASSSFSARMPAMRS